MTAIQFLDLLRRSQLVDEEKLQTFLNWPGDANHLAAAMIQAGLLTEWQAEKLLEGKHKGFMLGKYKLLRHLRKTSLSQMYVAEHTLMKRKVAIKVLPHTRVAYSYLDSFRLEGGGGELQQEGAIYFMVVPLEGPESGPQPRL